MAQFPRGLVLHLSKSWHSALHQTDPLYEFKIWFNLITTNQLQQNENLCQAYVSSVCAPCIFGFLSGIYVNGSCIYLIINFNIYFSYVLKWSCHSLHNLRRKRKKRKKKNKFLSYVGMNDLWLRLSDLGAKYQGVQLS